ncbi:MAG: anti-sigma factor antagonist [Chloroflexi bacterium]|nr:MAG: anti-sigma factor antagonist [Chloroflexota bacterium]
MKVTTKQFKRCDLVTATGRIDSNTAPQLAKAFDEISAANRFKIVFDMGGVDFISSAGLRVLINTQKNCKRWNRGELRLASVPQRIYEAMDLAGLLPLFKLFDDATEAVGSF